MKAWEEKLKTLLEFERLHRDEEATAEYSWIFHPTKGKTRVFFVWLDEGREIGGSRCKPHPQDRVEPWRFQCYLPKRFLRVMLSMCPPEEVAQAIAKQITPR